MPQEKEGGYKIDNSQVVLRKNPYEKTKGGKMLPKDVKDIGWPGNSRLKCLVCGQVWLPNLLSGGRIPRYGYCCPNCFEYEIRHGLKIDRNKGNRLSEISS